MVAEANTNFADLEAGDVIEFIVHVVAHYDGETDVGELTLQRCGFIDESDIDQLAKIVGEEFGERTLVGQTLEEIDETWLLVDFVATLYPGLQ